MIRTALFKALDHLSDQLWKEFNSAALWEVIPPVSPAVTSCLGGTHYRIDIEVLASPGVLLRTWLLVERDLDR